MNYCASGERCKGCPVDELPADKQEQAVTDINDVLDTHYFSVLRNAARDGRLEGLVEEVIFPDEDTREWIGAPERDPATASVHVVMSAVTRIVDGKHDSALKIG